MPNRSPETPDIDQSVMLGCASADDITDRVMLEGVELNAPFAQPLHVRDAAITTSRITGTALMS